MSEVVNFKGRIKKINRIPSETLEDQSERIVKDRRGKNFDLPQFYDSYSEYLEIELSGIYYLDNKFIYEVEREAQFLDDDFFIAKDNKDDTIDFDVRYYNGGCSFNEAIKTAIDNMNNK